MATVVQRPNFKRKENLEPTVTSNQISSRKSVETPDGSPARVVQICEPVTERVEHSVDVGEQPDGNLIRDFKPKPFM